MENQTTYPTSATLQTSAKTRAAVRVQSAGRLLFVDNLRIFLTVLVLLHHAMITYANSGGWAYIEGREDFATSLVGRIFCTANQAYFMSLFLLISAYFVPGSYDRKGAGRFLKDRLVRLGIPLAIYCWVFRPLFGYAGFSLSGEINMPFWTWLRTEYFSGEIIGGGPMWFIETLLIFSLVYAGWRLITRSRPVETAKESPFPRDRWIVLFTLGVGLVTFLARLWYPVDTTFEPLNLQLGNFPQYIALFIAGLVAYRRNWLLGLPENVGRRWLIIAGILILLLLPLMMMGSRLENPDAGKGGMNWVALLYATYQTFLCVAMCIGVVYIFRRYFDRQGRLANVLSRNAYTAYLIHEPILVILALGLSGLFLYPLLKFALVAIIAIPLIFALSGLVRKIPYADRAL